MAESACGLRCFTLLLLADYFHHALDKLGNLRLGYLVISSDAGGFVLDVVGHD